MSTRYEQIKQELQERPRRWLVTGAAGFIGSNLAEALLRLNQTVVGLDNFATGHRRNLEDVRRSVGEQAWAKFQFMEGDIVELSTCAAACKGAEYVLHQAALGSVPRSLQDPVRSHRANVDGQLNMLVAARDSGVKRFVFASSSSTYGDHPDLPKVEDRIGRPLSPYALTKLVNEFYAEVFGRCYGVQCMGLRYFNVFGQRQDPHSAYAAVIPKWVGLLLQGQRCVINGDGETSRDFSYVENVIQGNLLAATAENAEAVGQIYNIACGGRTTLNQLYASIRDGLAKTRPEIAGHAPKYEPFRKGDVRHSLADIGKATRLLGYAPTHTVEAGLREALAWYVKFADQ